MPALLPTLRIAPAVGWRGDAHPTAAAETEVVAFARGLDDRARNAVTRYQHIAR